MSEPTQQSLSAPRHEFERNLYPPELDELRAYGRAFNFDTHGRRKTSGGYPPRRIDKAIVKGYLETQSSPQREGLEKILEAHAELERDPASKPGYRDTIAMRGFMESYVTILASLRRLNLVRNELEPNHPWDEHSMFEIISGPVLEDLRQKGELEQKRRPGASSSYRFEHTDLRAPNSILDAVSMNHIYDVIEGCQGTSYGDIVYAMKIKD